MTFDLVRAVSTAKPGDTIRVPSGAYGDIALGKLVFAIPVTIAAENPNDPPNFRSLTVGNCEGLTLDGLTIRLTPDARTISATAALRIVSSKRILVRACVLASGMAVVGIARTAAATEPRPGDSIVGMPIGRGVTLYDCVGVAFDACDVSNAHKGIVVDKCSDVSIIRTDVHHCRTSAISGGGNKRVRIDGSYLHTSTPWRYGEDPKSDHGDFIHFWTVAEKGAADGVVITGNLIDQADGAPIMSIFLEDRLGLGFPGMEIRDNAIINGDAQGIAPTNASGIISGNALLRTARSPNGKPTKGPCILLRGDCNIVIEDNTLHDAFYNNVRKAVKGGRYSRNKILPDKPDAIAVLDATRSTWRAKHRPTKVADVVTSTGGDPYEPAVVIELQPGLTAVLRGGRNGLNRI